MSNVGKPELLSDTSISMSLLSSSPALKRCRKLLRVSSLASLPAIASITRFSAASSADAWTSFLIFSLVWVMALSTKSRIICSTSRPTYPTSVNLVASTFIKGASANLAKRRAISVFPTPVGPIIRIFFGCTSSRTVSSSCCLLQRFRSAIATALLASD